MDASSNADNTALFERQLADAPDLMAFFETNLAGRARAKSREALVKLADSSAFSLKQWVEALSILRARLDARDLTIPVEAAIGYVSCAAEAAGPGANLSDLPTLVVEMFDAYGCERAEPRG